MLVRRGAQDEDIRYCLVGSCHEGIESSSVCGFGFEVELLTASAQTKIFLFDTYLFEYITSSRDAVASLQVCLAMLIDISVVTSVQSRPLWLILEESDRLDILILVSFLLPSPLPNLRCPHQS